jgi:hypothetical protein
MLEQHNPAIRAAARQLAEKSQQLSQDRNGINNPPIKESGISLSTPTTQRATRFLEAKKLIADGHSLRAVARMLKLNRKTVIKYQHYEQYPARHQPPSRQPAVLPWKDYLVKQWNEGEHNRRQLWQQIK